MVPPEAENGMGTRFIPAGKKKKEARRGNPRTQGVAVDRGGNYPLLGVGNHGGRNLFEGERRQWYKVTPKKKAPQNHQGRKHASTFTEQILGEYRGETLLLQRRSIRPSAKSQGAEGRLRDG